MSQGALWAPENSKVHKKEGLAWKGGVLFALGSMNSGLSRSGKLPPAGWVQRGGQQPQLCGGQLGGQILGPPGKRASGFIKMPHLLGSCNCSMECFRGKVWWGFGPSVGCMGTARDRLGGDGGTGRPPLCYKWNRGAPHWLPADLSKDFTSFSDETGNESPLSPCAVAATKRHVFGTVPAAEVRSLAHHHEKVCPQAHSKKNPSAQAPPPRLSLQYAMRCL